MIIFIKNLPLVHSVYKLFFAFLLQPANYIPWLIIKEFRNILHERLYKLLNQSYKLLNQSAPLPEGVPGVE